MTKVAIVGVGHVGAALAYSLLGVESVPELQLVGRNLDRLKGEALDLAHAASMFPATTRIDYGQIEDCRDSTVVVLALSHPQTSVDRNDLAIDNARIFKQVVPQLAAQNPAAVFVVASNPVEALTQWTIELSGLPGHQVLGAGTVIDSCRFRAAMCQHLGVHPDDLRGYVLGEHGASQFLWETGATVGGVRIPPEQIPPAVMDATRSSGVEIFRLKGHTSYAISEALRMIVRAVVGNRLRTMPVSTQVELGDDFPPLCLAAPSIVGRQGVVRKLEPEFSPAEQEKWLACGRSVAATLERIRSIVG